MTQLFRRAEHLMKEIVIRICSIGEIGYRFAHGLLSLGSITGLLMIAGAQAATVTVWESHVLGKGATNTVTVTMEGDRCRIDLTDLLTVLLHGDTGYEYQIFHPTKSYVRHSLTNMQTASPCGDGTNIHPVPTGGSSVIGGHIVHEYRLTNACGERVLWVAPDFPGWKGFSAAIAPTTSALAGRTGFPLGGGGALPGMVVQSDTIAVHNDSIGRNGADGGLLTTNRATLVSARFIPQDAALLALPTGYHEVKAFPAGPSTNDAIARLITQEDARLREMASTNANPLGSLESGGHRPGPDLSRAERIMANKTNAPSGFGAAAPSPGTVVSLRVATWGGSTKTNVSEADTPRTFILRTNIGGPARLLGGTTASSNDSSRTK
jgi:hypothetical protein